MATTRSPARWLVPTAGLLVLGFVIGAAACASKSTPAGLEVIVATNLDKGDYDQITIDVEEVTTAGDSGVKHNPLEFSGTLPTSFAIAPGKTPNETASIVVTAVKNGAPVVRRSVTAAVPTTRVAELVIILSASCAARCGGAPPSDGACGATTVNSGALPTYEPGDIDHVDAGPFDASAQKDGSVCDAPIDHATHADAKPDTATACSCVPTPAGWDVVALMSSACPPGFGSPVPYVASVSADPVSCSCTCGSQDCSGHASLDEYSTADCGAPLVSATEISFVNQCAAVASVTEIKPQHSYKLTAEEFAATPACTATPTIANKPAVVSQSVSLCTPSQTCTNGDACLTKEEEGAICLVAAEATGTVPCPTGYPMQTIVAVTYDDTRGCGACACESALNCNFTHVLLSDNAKCGTVDESFLSPTTSTCVVASSTFEVTYNWAAATGIAIDGGHVVAGHAACIQSTPSTPNGSVALDEMTTKTVCCTQ